MKKLLICACALAVLCLAMWLVLPIGPDGRTVQSRQEILRKLPKDIEWTIDSELAVGDMLVAGMHASGLDGLAVFKPQGKGRYACTGTHYREDGEIVTAEVATGQGIYRACWLDRPDAVQADVRLVTDSGEEEFQIPVQGSEIVYFDAPSGDYTMHIRYLLSDGSYIN